MEDEPVWVTDVRCGICFELFTESLTTPCGNDFCYGCLNHWFATARTCRQWSHFFCLAAWVDHLSGDENSLSDRSQPASQSSNTTPLAIPRPTFTSCGTFSGTTGVSAAEWLRNFDFEMEDHQDAEGRFPPGKYLNYLEMLLTDEAYDWSESNPYRNA